jgi:hypothetical protein
MSKLFNTEAIKRFPKSKAGHMLGSMQEQRAEALYIREILTESYCFKSASVNVYSCLFINHQSVIHKQLLTSCNTKNVNNVYMRVA